MNREEYEKFFYKVIKDLGHDEWKLEWYKDSRVEGYCWPDRKIINIGPSAGNIKRLMIHEIAHIDTCLNKNNKHKKEFWQKYVKLLEKYLPSTKISKSEKYHKKLNTERICESCGLLFSSSSLGGYYLCSHCDRGVFRDGTRWSYEEAVNEEMRKEKAKQIYEKNIQ